MNGAASTILRPPRSRCVHVRPLVLVARRLRGRRGGLRSGPPALLRVRAQRARLRRLGTGLLDNAWAGYASACSRTGRRARASVPVVGTARTARIVPLACEEIFRPEGGAGERRAAGAGTSPSRGAARRDFARAARTSTAARRARRHELAAASRRSTFVERRGDGQHAHARSAAVACTSISSARRVLDATAAPREGARAQPHLQARCSSGARPSGGDPTGACSASPRRRLARALRPVTLAETRRHYADINARRMSAAGSAADARKTWCRARLARPAARSTRARRSIASAGARSPSPNKSRPVRSAAMSAPRRRTRSGVDASRYVVAARAAAGRRGQLRRPWDALAQRAGPRRLGEVAVAARSERTAA